MIQVLNAGVTHKAPPLRNYLWSRISRGRKPFPLSGALMVPQTTQIKLRDSSCFLCNDGQAGAELAKKGPGGHRKGQNKSTRSDFDQNTIYALMKLSKKNVKFHITWFLHHFLWNNHVSIFQVLTKILWDRSSFAYARWCQLLGLSGSMTFS